MSETSLMRAIQVRATLLCARLFRNQTGRYELKDGRWLASGLCKGSSDLIGWRRILITPEMVGQVIAQFVAVEVKSGKEQPTPEQLDFIHTVREHGGLAFVARSEKDLDTQFT